MKILHVISTLATSYGGPSRAMVLMERALLDQGIAVETATTDDDGAARRNGKPCGIPLNEQGVVRRYFPKRLEFYKLSPGFARWITRRVCDYDLLHIHGLFNFTSVAAAWAAKWAGVPYVLRPYGTLNRYGVTQRRPWLKRLSLKLVEGPILRHAAAVHFTSEAEQQEADELGIPMRGVVIPLAVEPVPAVDSAPLVTNFPQLSDKHYILFLSRLDPKKNVEGLLKAICLCAPGLPDTCWVIAGDGEPAYVSQLHKQAVQLGISDRVLWAGHLGGDLKSAAFGQAAAFILPSFSENFGIAAAEALAAGLPCILGEGVALSVDVVTAGAGLAVSTEPEKIAEAINQIMNDDAKRTHMAVNAKQLAEVRYSLEAMGKQLLMLYQQILVHI